MNKSCSGCGSNEPDDCSYCGSNLPAEGRHTDEAMSDMIHRMQKRLPDPGDLTSADLRQKSDASIERSGALWAFAILLTITLIGGVVLTVQTNEPGWVSIKHNPEGSMEVIKDPGAYLAIGNVEKYKAIETIDFGTNGTEPIYIILKDTRRVKVIGHARYHLPQTTEAMIALHRKHGGRDGLRSALEWDVSQMVKEAAGRAEGSDLHLFALDLGKQIDVGETKIGIYAPEIAISEVRFE